MDMAGWRAYKNSQWDLIAGALPGMSWSQHGEGGNTFILGIDHPSFGEQRIIVGRPAVMKAATFKGQPGYVDQDVVDGGENMALSEMKGIVEDWKAGKKWTPRPPVRK